MKVSLGQLVTRWKVGAAEVARLRQENERLRTSLAEAQKAKTVAINQADELRKEKERLRVRLAEMKQSADENKKANERLGEKVASLREANEALARERKVR